MKQPKVVGLFMFCKYTIDIVKTYKDRSPKILSNKGNFLLKERDTQLWKFSV